MGSIFGFGAASVDFRVTTADYGEDYTEKLLAQETLVFGGGSVANCLVQISRLGGNPYYLGKLGNDWIGRKIIESLEDEKVCCNLAIADDNLCSPFNVAVYAGADKRRVGGYLVPNSLSDITCKDAEEFCSHMEQGDWIITEIGEIPLNTLYSFCQIVKKKQVNLVIDVDLDPIKQCGGNIELVKEIFKLADVLLPNFNSLKSMYESVDAKIIAEEVSSEFQAICVITKGEDGAYYCMPDASAKHYPTNKIEALDTVGAGDAFHGGLMYALADNCDVKDAIALGTQCARINCMSFGARTGMPTYNQIDLKRK